MAIITSQKKKDALGVLAFAILAPAFLFLLYGGVQESKLFFTLGIANIVGSLICGFLASD